ncbi:hypothetical protein [Streptomyces subrutilus]|uniref:Uncharacterized protein n=1 Tax=Streptomyces subrutilus TaxID=36818 RepID=A0A1E5PUQ4_9ACTN|nr:hypothetical protein [Streptomyces subrutilus]OEJ33203.1 hypothetical protein BGK67_19420 [Streptomyces subrutilus]
MHPKPYEEHGPGDPTAARAALGLALLAVGGWLLTTARPWLKPGPPPALALGWTASGAMLVCGLLLPARCVRTVHAEADRSGETPPGPPDRGLRPSGPPSTGR